jgi:RNA polymerase primary sigma factor
MPTPYQTRYHQDAPLQGQAVDTLYQDDPQQVQAMLHLRYGLTDGQAHTFEVIGRQLGLTRERVRQIEAAALQELRAHGGEGLRAYLDAA